MVIERATCADRINAILNDPEVRPYVVSNDDRETLDVTAPIADKRNHFIIGEHGAVLCFWIMDGLYEFHVAVLPKGRGKWAFNFSCLVEEYMFTATDAVELLTRIPEGHRASIALAQIMSYQKRWDRPECIWNGAKQIYWVWSKTMQEWLETRDIHEVVATMSAVGNVRKAVAWHNRWALLSREKRMVLD